MIKAKKYVFTAFFLSVLILLAGCQKQGKIDEGECKLEFRLRNIPDSINDLPDNLIGLFEVEVIFINVSNKKRYNLSLNSENKYMAIASLNPGTYQIESCYVPNSRVFYCDPKVSANSVVLKKGEKTQSLEVTISDADNLDQLIKNTTPSAQILKEDIFSRKIQIDGRYIDMEDILKENLKEFQDTKTPIEDMQVASGKSEEVTGKGITVEVYNSSSETLHVSKCKVISIKIGGNVAVLPKGLRLGLSLSEVTNAKHGLYKTPDKCKGLLLPIEGFEDMSCIFNDEESGDRLVINFNCNGWYVDGMKYEFQMYE